ncbi:MAG: ankyrin repeat domain-containing protein [Cellvibrionaceae bacterium]
MKFNHLIYNAFLVFMITVFYPSISAATDIFQYIEKGATEEVIKYLDEDVIDLEKNNSAGDTPVIVAARYDRLEILRLLVRHGANINALDIRKRDVLNIAITTNNPELARTAITLGADPTLITSVYEGGAIIYGSAKGAVEIVDLLIKAGAPVNRVNKLGWTALLEVAILGDGSKNYITIAEMLIKAGADKTIKDKEGKTAFDHAYSKGHNKLARILSPSVSLQNQ